MPRFRLIAIILLLATSACTTTRETDPAQSATEQLLMSAAADRAADNLAVKIPKDSRVFVDAGNLDGTDSKYAVSVIRDRLLRQGAHLVDDKKNAQTIVEIRSGALSTDKKEFLIGIPQFNIPVPLATAGLTFPEIALYKTEDQKGVAKFGITSYDAKTGALAGSQAPQYGFSNDKEITILIFISWKENDYLPKKAQDLSSRISHDVLPGDGGSNSPQTSPSTGTVPQNPE